MSNYVGGDGNTLIDTELYQLLVTGNVIGFNRVVSSSQVDVLELRCASDNNTVLHIACSSREVELVNDILIQWPELMVQGNSQGDLPIHTAIKTGRINVAVVDALASWLQQQQASGINVVVHQVLEWSNVEGNTALHTALEVYDDEEVKQARELVDLYPPTAYAMNIEGICPLYLAIQKELADLVQHMLQKLQPFKEDALNCLTKGQSVLHAVVSAQKTEMLEHLLLYDDGKLINLVNEEGLTALSYATFEGYLEKVQIFDTKVPNSAFICNKDKSFPIHQAVRGGHISIIGY
ncbi:protein ACCELERATED CELL DEATH 6-like [Chenopodium quinoa]|uniref:protein ACCELERATED CELL DEATH 6-like n=1 Tax=Chenopodium quinoa TaxID=63459 RepID=UPI000B77F427|nr:protein ACCELERATED CELL DEATH 6-like [Chenopodium quinoa]